MYVLLLRSSSTIQPHDPSIRPIYERPYPNLARGCRGFPSCPHPRSPTTAILSSNTSLSALWHPNRIPAYGHHLTSPGNERDSSPRHLCNATEPSARVRNLLAHRHPPTAAGRVPPTKTSLQCTRGQQRRRDLDNRRGGILKHPVQQYGTPRVACPERHGHDDGHGIARGGPGPVHRAQHVAAASTSPSGARARAAAQPTLHLERGLAVHALHVGFSI